MCLKWKKYLEIKSFNPKQKEKSEIEGINTRGIINL